MPMRVVRMINNQYGIYIFGKRKHKQPSPHPFATVWNSKVFNNKSIDFHILWQQVVAPPLVLIVGFLLRIPLWQMNHLSGRLVLRNGNCLPPVREESRHGRNVRCGQEVLGNDIVCSIRDWTTTVRKLILMYWAWDWRRISNIFLKDFSCT